MEKEDVATNNEEKDDASETQDVYVKDENGLDEEEKKVVDKAKELDDEVSKKQKKNNKKKIIIIVIILIFIIGGAFSYFYFFNGKDNKKEQVSNEKKEYKSAYRMEGNDLSDFDLYFLQLENAKKNAIYSPLSIKYALAMLQEGTKGDSKAQINALIGDYKSKKYTNSEHLSLANAMFIKSDMKDTIVSDYTNNLSTKYGAEVIYDNFTTATNVNNWISKKTLNLLNNVLKDTDVNNLDFLLVNSLAIDMDWNYKLQWEQSDSKVDEKRYSVDYAHEKYEDFVPLIQDKSQFSTISFNNGAVQAKAAQIGASINNYDIIKELGEDNIRKFIEEKYREYLKNPQCGEENTEEQIKSFVNEYIKTLGENYKQIDSSTDFLFYTNDDVKVFAKDLKTYDNTTLQYVGIMPNKVSLEEFINKTNAKSISKLISSLKPLELSSFEYGKVYKIKGFIPFFKYDYELKLANDLKSLGVKDIFDASKADLSGMMKNSSGEFISKAIHKANIDFSNDGIKASAVTVVGGMGSASCPTFDYEYEVPVEEIDLTFDKPFMYVIRDKSTGEVWFTGSVYEPRDNY